MDGDYPKEISEGFTGIPSDLDAAMVWSGNGKIYFFKGKIYIIYDKCLFWFVLMVIYWLQCEWLKNYFKIFLMNNLYSTSQFNLYSIQC